MRCGRGPPRILRYLRIFVQWPLESSYSDTKLGKIRADSAEKFPAWSAKAPPQQSGLVVSDLIQSQKVVERMLSDGVTLAEVEDYIEGCALDE